MGGVIAFKIFKVIDAFAPHGAVVAGIAVDGVVARLAQQGVVALVAFQPVIAIPAG